VQGAEQKEEEEGNAHPAGFAEGAVGEGDDSGAGDENAGQAPADDAEELGGAGKGEGLGVGAASGKKQSGERAEAEDHCGDVEEDNGRVEVRIHGDRCARGDGRRVMNGDRGAGGFVTSRGSQLDDERVMSPRRHEGAGSLLSFLPPSRLCRSPPTLEMGTGPSS